MRRYRMLLPGLVMVGLGGRLMGLGARLIFVSPPALPLWFVWLGGLFLWNFGIAFCMAGLLLALFFPVSGS